MAVVMNFRGKGGPDLQEVRAVLDERNGSPKFHLVALVTAYEKDGAVAGLIAKMSREQWSKART